MFTLGAICDHCGKEATPMCAKRDTDGRYGIVWETFQYMELLKKCGWEYNGNGEWTCPTCLIKKQSKEKS